MGSYGSKATTKGKQAVPARGEAQTTVVMAGEWENPRASEDSTLSPPFSTQPGSFSRAVTPLVRAALGQG